MLNIINEPVSGKPVSDLGQQLKLQDKIEWFVRRVAHAQHLPPDEMMSETVEVDPDFATWLLTNKNPSNRPIQPKKAYQHAQRILEGRWILVSQGISISREGNLNDGQHRLTGIFISGETVKLYMTFGESRMAQKVIDTGSKRTTSDTLAMAGEANFSIVAAACKLLNNIQNENYSNGREMPNDKIEEFLENHSWLRQAAALAGLPYKKLRHCPPTAYTVAFYLIRHGSKKCAVKPDLINIFCDNLAHGSDLKDHPAIVTFRDGVLGKKLHPEFDHDGTRSTVYVAMIINTWNEDIKKRSGAVNNKRIVWTSGTSFPIPL